MSNESQPPSIDEVITRIHGEIERRRASLPEQPGAAGPVAPGRVPGPAALRLQPSFTPRADGGYKLHELIDFHDVDFVTNAYRALLGRWPDPVGLRHYVDLLRRGDASKIDVLGRIRWSREGRRREIRVRGLLPRFALERGYRVPVLGWLLHWGVTALGLPRVARGQRRLEAFAVFRDEALAAGVRSLEERMEQVAAATDDLTHGLRHVRSFVEQEMKAREDLGGLLSSRLQDLALTLTTEASAREGLASSLDIRLSALAAELEAERRARLILEQGRSDLERLDAALAVQNRSLRDLGGDAARMQGELGGLSQRVSTLETDRSLTQELARLAERLTALDQELSARIRGVAELAGTLGDEMRGEITEREALAGGTGVRLERTEQVLLQLRHEVVQQARRVDVFLAEARRRLPEPFAEEQIRVFAGEEQHRLDALYVSLEDELRGPPGLIKQRLEPYLPLLREAGAASERWPLLDLGCGRGEWLDLLRERDLVGLGVDRNPVLVQGCRDRGLRVEEADLLEHLRKLPPASLGAVTGFHVIEHLPLEILVDMLAEVARVLHTGGIAIFETPNPANLLVGSHTFYLDPTHRNPLPSLLMRFLAEARGLSRVEVIEINPSEDLPPLPGDDPLTRRFNEFFCRARDYAVVGYRA